MSIEIETTFEYSNVTVTITKDTDSGLLGYEFKTTRSHVTDVPMFRYMDSVKKVAKSAVRDTLRHDRTDVVIDAKRTR